MSRITLPDRQETDVTIPDGDVKRVYKVAPLVRAKKREVSDLLDKIQAMPDDNTPDNERDGVRLACDILNSLAASPNEGAPAAGDLLFQQWEANETEEWRITALMTSLLEAVADPT